MERHVVVPSVNVFIISADKLLLSRRKDTGWMDGYLCAPGGHIESGETPTEAIIREISEELGATVQPTDLEFICVISRILETREYVSYEFVIRDKDYTFTNAEPLECSELVWVDINNLPDDIIPVFKQVIERSLLGHDTLIETNC